MMPPNGWNIMLYKNERVDELIDTAKMEADPEKRLNMYKELWTILMDDAPWVFLYSAIEMGAHRTDVHGMYFCPKGYAWAHHAWKE